MYKIVAKGHLPTMGCNFALPGMLLFALIGILIKITPSCGPKRFGVWPGVTNFAKPLQRVLEPFFAADLEECAFPMKNIEPQNIFRVTSCDRANSSWSESSVTYWSRYTVSNIGVAKADQCLVVRHPHNNNEQKNCSETYNGENELICAGGTPPSTVWDVHKQECFQDQFKVNYFDNTGKKVLSPKTGTEWVFPVLFGIPFPFKMKRGYWELSIHCELFLKNGDLLKTLNVYSRLSFGNTISNTQAKADIDSVIEDINSGTQFTKPMYDKVFFITPT